MLPLTSIRITTEAKASPSFDPPRLETIVALASGRRLGVAQEAKDAARGKAKAAAAARGSAALAAMPARFAISFIIWRMLYRREGAGPAIEGQKLKL
jgi:hypothetical protein